MKLDACQANEASPPRLRHLTSDIRREVGEFFLRILPREDRTHLRNERRLKSQGFVIGLWRLKKESVAVGIQKIIQVPNMEEFSHYKLFFMDTAYEREVSPPSK